jgi:hypothetical protein
MAVRFPFQTVGLTPGTELYNYWGPQGFSRPSFDIYVVGPRGQHVHVKRAQVDSASDWVVFEPRFAIAFGLIPPFSRQVGVTTAGGQVAFTLLPRDGDLSLFVTDYTEYYFLPAPPIGFWTGPVSKNVLGTTGFLQYFSWRVLNDGVARPDLELEAIPNFPGRQGFLPRRVALADFLQQLRSGR